jgi:hypothetical protein
MGDWGKGEGAELGKASLFFSMPLGLAPATPDQALGTR